MNDFLKYIYHKWIDGSARWYPMLSVFYLTNSCDFRCPYCSDGLQRPYYKLPSSILPPDSVLSLLKIIRRLTDSIVITGGEPLNYPNIPYVMEHIKDIHFRNVIFTTNGYNIDLYLNVLSSSVTSLVFSLDTLDEEKADAWYSIGKGALRKIVCNIDKAASNRSKKYDIIISSVVTPYTIKDLYDVYYYAKEHDFIFAACPQLVGVKAHESLIDTIEYKEFYDFLISEKIAGARIQGTVLYLKYMRDLKKFYCRPYTMLVVSPTGDVFYPCLEIGNFAGNLLKENNLHIIRQQGLKEFGPQPDCDNRCHSACALGFSLILNNPFSLLYEAYILVKAWVKRCFTR